MPALSPTMEQGKILSYHVSVGQEIEAGESIATVETDKATMEFEVQEDGIIAWINEEAVGVNTKLGQVCAIVVDSKDNLEAFKNYTPGQTTKASTPQTSTPEKNDTSSSSPVQTQIQKNVSVSKNIFISPRALNKFISKGLSKDELFTKLRKLSENQSNIGSGPNNRIIEQDVESLFKQFSESPKTVSKVEKTIKTPTMEPTGSYKEVELSTMRRVIADRLSQSKREIPHYYLEAELRMDALLDMKKDLQNKAGIKLSINDFIVKAVSKACQEVPECNTNFVDNKIRFFDNVDVR